MKEKIIEIYTDATCQHWSKTNGFAWGKICWTIPETKKVKLEELKIENPELKQFINRFELLAIERAWKYAKRYYRNKEIRIYSDSQVAVKWAKRKGISVFWIPRDLNKADEFLYH